MFAGRLPLPLSGPTTFSSLQFVGLHQYVSALFSHQMVFNLGFAPGGVGFGDDEAPMRVLDVTAERADVVQAPGTPGAGNSNGTGAQAPSDDAGDALFMETVKSRRRDSPPVVADAVREKPPALL